MRNTIILCGVASALLAAVAAAAPGRSTAVRRAALSFEAPSVEALRHAGRRAELAYERIVEAVEGSADETKEEEK